VIERGDSCTDFGFEEIPESYYLQLTQPEAIVIVLGARDGAPSPDLLPREKQPSEAKR